jgi:hypothetical protein
MAALNIPGVGERIGPIYQRVMTYGATAESPDVSFATATGDVILININEANVFVYSLEAQNVIAYDTTAMIVGDGDDTDGWWTDTLLDHTTDGVFNWTTGVGYGTGKLYTSSDTIDINVSVAKATTGKTKFRITYQRGVDTDISQAASSA